MIATFLNTLKRNKIFVGINLLFFIIYSLICFVNHYSFRSYALDLGAYTRTLCDYAHFHFSYGEVFREVPENMLSDHFDLLLMLFSPLWWVFGQITLLVVQLAAIHFGALGVFKLARQSGLDNRISNATTFVFLSYFGIFSGVSFDYHSNVVAACLLPWFILFFNREKPKRLILIFILIVIAKENMALWMFFICTGLLFQNRKSFVKRKIAISLSLTSLLFFVWLLFYAMPYFSLGKQYSHIEFHVMGNSFKEIIVNIVQQPIKAFSLLFQNHSEASFNFIKAETWIFWLLSGGFLMLYRPVFLWILIPLMMQKMYHDDPTKWSVAQQYNIEFAPMAVWCLIDVLKGKQQKAQLILASVVAILCFAVTVRLCDHTIGFVDKTRIRFYQADHYQSDFNKKEVYNLMNEIPANAIVSAQNMFVPHLISKKAVYQYPIVRNAQYILLSTDIHAWPLTPQKVQKQIDSLSLSNYWATAHVKNGVYLFKTK